MSRAHLTDINVRTIKPTVHRTGNGARRMIA